jgi:tRNA wybutosine-synthesizing protein 1
MINKNIEKIFKKQHYILVGKHSAVQICRWTKKSLLGDGFCYKERFYGISSHACCQMSPYISCPNSCVHCWRPIELDFNLNLNPKIKEIDEPKKIIEECIRAQRKLLSGFKGNKKVNMKKWKQAQNPGQFAISLIGEPTLYPKLAELIKELKKYNKLKQKRGIYDINIA